MVIDVTALGSKTLVALHSVIAGAVLLSLGDRRAVLQLVAASTGAAVWTVMGKTLFERARPVVVSQVVHVQGFSYPSGHTLAAAAMYVTIACLVYPHLSTRRARLAVVGMAAAVVALIGASRVYLGVHYPSDVASGICMGTAWAFFLGAVFAR